MNSSPPWRPAKSLDAEHARDGDTDGRQHFVALFVPEEVVHLLEVVEIEEDDTERSAGAIRLRDHSLERVLDRAPVREAGEPVGQGSCLRESKVAQVGEHR